MKRRLMGTGMVLLALACSSQAIDLDAARASLEEAVTGYHEAAAAADAERVMSFYAADGAMMPPNEPDAAGTTAVQAQVDGFTSLQDFQFHAEEPTIVLSAGGEMGYSVATVHLSWTADGETVTEQLRDVHIWTRDEGGSWKLAVDVWNSLTPVAN